MNKQTTGVIPQAVEAQQEGDFDALKVKHDEVHPALSALSNPHSARLKSHSDGWSRHVRESMPLVLGNQRLVLCKPTEHKSE